MPSPDWKHLGEVVAQERERLRLTQGELQGRGGPSVTLVRQIEKASNPGITARTKSALEDALGWERGVVDEILAGEAEPRRRKPPVDFKVGGGGPTLEYDSSVSDHSQDEPEFEFLTRVREDLTDEEMDQLMKEATPYLQMLMRDIKARRG